MINSKAAILIVIALFISNIIYSQQQTVLEFTLKQAQDYALQNNVDVKNALLDIEKAKKKVWETTAMGLPQANSSLSYSDMMEIPTQLMPDFLTPAIVGVNQGYFGLTPTAPYQAGDPMPVQFGTKYNSTFDFTASQLVFSGPYLVGLQASKIFKQISEQSHEKTEIETKESVAQSYYLVLLSEEMKVILQNNLTNAQKLYDETQQMYNNGFVEETDVDQLKVMVLNLKNAISSINRQITVTYNLLKFQMGVEVAQQIKLTENLNAIILQLKVDEVLGLEFDLNKHIDYKLINTQERLMFLDQKRFRYDCLPSITAFYTNQQNAMRSDFNFFDSDEDWFPTEIFGVNLSIPILSSGMRWAKIQQAKIELEKTRNTKWQVEQGLALNVLQSKSDFSTSYEKYTLEKQNLELTKKIFDRTSIKYKEGLVSSLELSQANGQYLSTQSNYTTAVVELLNAKLRLDKALNNY